MPVVSWPPRGYLKVAAFERPDLRGGMTDTGTVAEFLAALRRCDLPETPEWESLAGRATDAVWLANELVRSGSITQFQGRQLLQGKGDDLVMGPFLLLDRIGAGGMGQVFKARHRLMGRIVALKFIRPELLGEPTAVARFQQEVQAASSLSHQNIVQAFHAERTPRGFFLAMEFCDGRDLGRVVAEGGPVPVGLACDYVTQVASGLSAAHAVGLVHRDIKPGNLLLTDGTVKVLDFGLARLPRPEDTARLTRTGALMGTPDFIAPEQARDASTADIRADVYSLGCTLYYLLAGQVPFPGGADWEKVLKHMSHSPMPVETVRPSVPREVGVVVRKMMAREPADRYQTPAEVETALLPFRNTTVAPTRAEFVTPVTKPSPSVRVGTVADGRSLPTTPPYPAMTHGVMPNMLVETSTPSAPFTLEPQPLERLEPDAEPLAPVTRVARETLTGRSGGTTSDYRPSWRGSQRGVWVAAALAFVVVVVVVATRLGDGKSRAEQEQAAQKKDGKDPGPKTGPNPKGEVEPAGRPAVFKEGETILSSRTIFRLAYHPKNADILAVARGEFRATAEKGGVEVWNVKKGTRAVVAVSDGCPSVFAVAFSADGKLFACGAGSLDADIPDAEVAVFETETWALRHRVRTDSNGVFALAFLPRDSRFLVVGTMVRNPEDIDGNSGIEVWDGGNSEWNGAAKPTRRSRESARGGGVNAIVFFPKMYFGFTSLSWKQTAKRWNFDASKPGDALVAGVPLPLGKQEIGAILAAAITDDGKYVVAVTARPPTGKVSQQLLLWTVLDNSNAELRVKNVEDKVNNEDKLGILSVAILPDQSGFVTGDKSGRVRVWNLPDLEERPLGLRSHAQGNIWGVAFSPDKKTLAVAGPDADWAPRITFIPVADLANK